MIGSVAVKGIAASSRLEGMCVTTMVLSKPLRSPNLPAAMLEAAWSSPAAKNMVPISCGVAP
ncbi:hypothetical protein GCM10009838_68210 [Catenulispora subtropica]|uniref:Uncharacterized protein n=1 Tax=Catenulispora subtropica TaxID=450798 RepID=A0ABN2SXG2_9ACTN